jgi:hypothetical protein
MRLQFPGVAGSYKVERVMRHWARLSLVPRIPVLPFIPYMRPSTTF